MKRVRRISDALMDLKNPKTFGLWESTDFSTWVGPASKPKPLVPRVGGLQNNPGFSEAMCRVDSVHSP